MCGEMCVCRMRLERNGIRVKPNYRIIPTELYLELSHFIIRKKNYEEEEEERK